MKNTTFKNILLGIVIALVATYLFPIALFIIVEWPRGSMALFFVLPLYATLYTSWMVIPLGAALGMLIPRMAQGKTRWMAALHGVGFGAAAGAASFFCFASVFRLGPDTGLLLVSIMVYCALWVGAYAFYRAKGQSLYR